ncbi:caspase family protein [Brevundimonas subvibrioides]|uniref:caspase family protein n=1 Tax=Brevundimonas subvibrioides TaxID=74313 RepID=UPI0022B4F077|nr:caspase family protein [Brevundimonas subvibrioides]
MTTLQARALASAVVGIWALIMASMPAAAQTADPANRHALLVAVSGYPGLRSDGRSRALAGTPNDVALLYRTLIESDVPAGNIRVLADIIGPDAGPAPPVSAGDPTRAAILAELDDLIDRAKPGEEVMIYLAGHGSFVPETAKTDGPGEPDGNDEIFLPLDIGVWNTAGAQVDNQILDDEFGERVSRLVDQGTFVWFVLDACHSGTGVRSGDTDIVTRDIAPTDLGVPTVPAPAGTRSPRADDRRIAGFDLTRSRPGGGLVAFYAVQPEQLALERPLPLELPADERRQHGLMTWSLVQAIRSGRSETYGDLAQTIMAEYWENGGGVRTPLFEGDLGRRTFLGGEGERSWRLENIDGALSVRAGLLDDVGEGAIFAVGRRTVGSGEAPIFYGRVTRSRLERADLEILRDPAFPDRLDEVLAARGLRRDQLEAWLANTAPALEARLVQRVPSFVLRVAVSPGTASGRPGEAVAAIRDTASGDLPLAIDWVQETGPADLRLMVAEDRLWFVPDTTALQTTGPAQPYSMPVEDVTPETLIRALRAVARTRNLIGVASAYRDSPISRALAVTVAIAPALPRIEERCQPHVPSRQIPAEAVIMSDAAAASATLIRPADCERVYLTVRNTGDQTLDITPLYLDAWNQTTFLSGYPRGRYEGLRLPAGAEAVVSYTEVAPPPGARGAIGTGRIVLLAVEARPGASIAADFRDLAGGLPSASRNAGPRTGFAALLEAATLGYGTVRSGPMDLTERGGARVVLFETFATVGGPGR